MRIAVIGLGDIAQKAYLPVLGVRRDAELILCSRNRGVLHDVASRYRIDTTAANVAELLGMPVRPDAAFVHTATESHAEVVGALLRAGVHVYVDKPLAYHYHEAEALADLARKKNAMLMVGFNRRFAPMLAALKQDTPPQLILMQKNRIHLPGEARRFVFDDFIHVADTLRFLAGAEATEIDVRAQGEAAALRQLVLQMHNADCSALGIMNRDNGLTEEILELCRPGEKWTVEDLNATTHCRHGERHVHGFGDWISVLHRRGFEQIVAHFLECVAGGGTPSIAVDDALETHALCERIVQAVQRGR